MLEVQRVGVRENDRALDLVRQLAHIARPAVSEQALPAALGNRLVRHTMALLQARQQRLGQLQDVAAALAERRKMKAEEVESMKQIFTESAFGDDLLEIAIGRRDDADVCGHFAGAAQPADSAVFN